VTTVARKNANRCFIDEFHLCASLSLENERPRIGGVS
jgi:hypothetical protein